MTNPLDMALGDAFLRSQASQLKGPQMNNTVRTLWTQQDEAKLLELQERRDRVMKENREPLERIVGRWGREGLVVGMVSDPRPGARPPGLKGMVDELIASADELRDALAPFDSGVRERGPG